MADTQSIITQVYTAFNHRDIDAALALMTDDIHWPKASEGGHVIGKEEIRAYWTRQWAAFEPEVHPLDITEPTPNTALVRVHQLVRSLSGDLLSDTEVHHRFTFANGLITRMDLDASAGTTPTAAFAKH